jgi:hypothetical protein
MKKLFLDEISKEVAITLTVDMPDLLHKLNIKKSVKDFVMDLLGEAFKTACMCLDEDFVSESDLRIASSTVLGLMDAISEIVTDENYLSIWIFFGTSIENWMEVCVEWEEYESATNLKKLLEQD